LSHWLEKEAASGDFQRPSGFPGYGRVFAHVGKAVLLEIDICFGAGGIMEVERIFSCIPCSGW